MFKILREQDDSIITAGILRASFFFCRLVGFLFFRCGSDKDGLVFVNDSRKCWRWFWLIHGIICLYGLYLDYEALTYLHADGVHKTIEDMIECARLGLIFITFVWNIRRQFFMDAQTVCLANKMLKLFRLVRHLSKKEKSDFGGKQELVLIVLIIFCRAYDFVLISAITLRTSIILINLLNLWCFLYIFFSVNIVLEFNFVWYLALGQLHSEYNEFLQKEVHNSKRTRLEVFEYLDIYSRIHEASISFKRIFNNYLFLKILLTILYVGGMSHKMIVAVSYGSPWIWMSIFKVMIEYKLLCSAFERLFNEIRKTRWIVFELSLLSKTKDRDQDVEMFNSFLNLNDFRFNVFGLFNISNSSYLKILAGLFNYLVFVIQSVMESKQIC